MFADDWMRGGQAKAGPIARAIGMLGCKKRIENMLQVVRGNAASLVLDLQLYPGCAAGLRQHARADLNHAVAVGHGIERIQ